MINEQHKRQVSYDESGNIIIEDSEINHFQDESPDFKEEKADKEDLINEMNKVFQRHHPQLQNSQSKVSHLAYSVLQESADQYRDSIRETKNQLIGYSREFSSFWGKVWSFLNQPVWVLKKHKEPKQYSRLTLFIFDTVRFGTTFSFLFVVLFSALNYQSYWKIISSHLNPLQYRHDQMQVSLNQTIHQKLLKTPSLSVAGYEEINLLAFLDPVGPPGKRLIISKLGLNVPIQETSVDPLINEEWEKLEENIQVALRDGVVHYPGTASPGTPGNFFLTGHSSYYPFLPGNYKDVFARLHELNPGDEYIVYYNGDAHRYKITEKKEVKPSDVTVLNQPMHLYQSTLMTCTPIGTTLRRLILVSQEVDMVSGETVQVGEKAVKEYKPIQVNALTI